MAKSAEDKGWTFDAFDAGTQRELEILWGEEGPLRAGTLSSQWGRFLQALCGLL